MDKRKTKVYTYTRVSTAMQIDGYSLDAQKSRMKAFAEYNDYEIVREYEDAGKSGKSIEGRVQFSQMMDDIKEGKDGVSYVLVFKLSRFGRNAADVLSTLQIMQDFGVNLICVEDGIDSSKDAGKLMISVLSAVAEIERENIRVQTMEGRIQKAREGKWNGGFAPYGYQLVDGKLEINEEEAVAIRVIFDQYVNTNIGSNGIAKYLENHGIRKIQRQNGKNPLFDAHLVRLILRNPVYCGKIAYGRRRTEKVHGTRNDYHLVEQENYLLVDGLHEAIVSEEIWQAAQVKLLAQAKKYEHVNKGKDTRTHLLSGIVKCPVCGAGMYGNKCIKHKKDGTKYKDFYYYGCKHRTMTRGHKCDYRKQINEELLDDAVAEIIVALVSKPKFATMMQEKINMKVDTSTIDQEVANHEKQLRQYYSTKSKLMEEIDSLDPDDRHYIKRKADLDDRLYRMYDKIEEEENLLVEARAKKQAIEAEKLTADNIYKVLIYFEKLYGVMNDVERRRFIEALISEIQIFPERQPNGQWLKSIKFKLPIIGENMELSLDNDKHVEDFAPEADRIHLANGTLALDGSFTEGRPNIVRSRLPVAYRPDAPAPVRWLSFLDGLLYAEDIPTLQEFIGYCLIPSNKGQRMMVIKGNGGEGKSQIGAVLGALLGSNMKDGSIGKISENRFARADLEHILLCVDDDMRMEALRQTNYVKSIVTAQGKMDLERKDKQSYQGWMFARLLAFSNGDLQALYDRSDGFYRRQLVLTAREKPAGRVDDPDLAEKLKAEVEGIFL